MICLKLVRFFRGTEAVRVEHRLVPLDTRVDIHYSCTRKLLPVAGCAFLDLIEIDRLTNSDCFVPGKKCSKVEAGGARSSD